MIELRTGTRIWIAAGYTDLRRGFQGLTTLVETVLEQAHYSGHVFVFRGKRGDLIKLLWWDGDGLCLFQKRLERGRFIWPQATTGTRHLYLDTTGIVRNYPKILDNPSTDIVTFEEYPHWDKLLGPGQPPTTAETLSHDAATVTAHGKVFIVNEFGWDTTNWKSSADLQHVLDPILKDPNIMGDGFWALQAHLDNFGFQPIPADSQNAAFAPVGECGEWWALYYPGIKTLVMSAEDMAARARQLRTHAYLIAGESVPRHAVPPAPVITSTVIGGLLAWRGSAGATRYSIERMDTTAKNGR